MSTFHIEQFGCRATQADAAAIERQLRAQGHDLAPVPTDADVIVVNTCTVTAAADSQAREAIRKLHAQNPAAKIIATGCYAQRAPEELAALPGVLHVVGNSHKPEIPGLISKIAPPHSASQTSNFVSLQTLSAEDASCTGAALLRPSLPEPTDLAATSFFSSPDSLALPKILTANIFTRSEFLSAPVLGGESNHTRPTLKIQDGCNLRCSYCVIPFVRGKSRSMPPAEVVSEIRRLTASGYREIVLSGINLGTWGRDLSPRIEFEDLLRRILDQTDVARLRISSIEPLDVTADLIALFASTLRIAQHFHMPLQSGSDRILAAMRRWYRSEHYARRVELIRAQLPDAAIGADVIAGFPGETAEDHAATLDFIDRRPFTYLHVFSYSVRPGTAAASMQSHVPAATVRARAHELRALSQKKSAAFRESQLDATLEILTLRHANKNGNHAGESAGPWTPAISTNYIQIRLAGTFPPNQLLRAKITRHKDGVLHASPETKNNFAVRHAASHL
ncbi:MAG TPA: tRNA (N(6)-L-threonylcarbamoyladenosine(37)-C(2))-methylthiotransferase MtaB [Candidatus Sulfotelmatobacter sp.]|nr:tRNA (N(6)-L-threonylcarbamoyladenosine(37)-C(2))-methylthiotransferase MtaB [Candidatus Sulfotelmatobacter sp.]